jgi:short subunit dehydrogenase-like uncharacterized protein
MLLWLDRKQRLIKYADQRERTLMIPGFLLYGANGYTGALIARAAVTRGYRPIVAGRNVDAIERLARELGLDYRVFALDNPRLVDEGLRGVPVVLHCAGPFSHTSRLMADACLRTGTHYLDITGEWAVFESLAARTVEARAAGVMLLPGVGFDVVPSDCLAAHLKRRLPAATRLALGFQSLGRVSRGTATTMVENLHRGGLVRRHGRVTPVPAAWKTRRIDFGTGPVTAMTIPWGDVATAYYSTGIANIEVYTAAPVALRLAAYASRYLGWLLGSQLVQAILKRRIGAGPPGPTDEQRSRGRTLLWGEAMDAMGRKIVSRLQGPDAYTLTVRAALAVIERILAGEAPAGFQTPSTAYGADFVLGLEGTIRLDE